MKEVCFLNKLQSEELGECGGKTIYRLTADLLFKDGKQIIPIPTGFQTDLASVPRVPVIYAMWGDRAHREAVLHDYLYRIDSFPDVSRLAADEYFKKAMISRGQPWKIYQFMYWGVRLGGCGSYHTKYVNHVYKVIE